MAGIPIPDFSGLANQQGQINQQAANQQTLANRPNQSNQYGNLTWTQGPGGTWTQNQSLAPGQQQIFDNASAGQANLSGILGQGVNTGGMAGWGDAGSLLNGVTGMPDSGFGASQQVIDAMKGLQQPGLTQARDAERARLAAMGITLGSDASNNSERVLGQNQNDADLKAILAGTQEFGNVFNRGMQSRQQGVSENSRAFDMAQALRGAQGQERIAFNQANLQNLQGLAGAKSSTDPKFAAFTGATALPPPNMYQAGLDTYNAALAQQNADRAASAGRTAGTAQLLGQGIQGLGGLSGIVGGLGAGWNALTGMFGDHGGSMGDYGGAFNPATDWGSDWGSVDPNAYGGAFDPATDWGSDWSSLFY